MPRRGAILTLMLYAGLTPPAAAETAGELLRQCLPEAPRINSEAEVHIEVSYKDRAPESYHYLRLEGPQHLFITPGNKGGPALLLDKPRDRVWHYDTETQQFSPAGPDITPLWLLSETLLQAHRLDTFALSISAHNSFGGMEYYTLEARLAGNPFPRRSLAFKRSAEGQCTLIRAAYFAPPDKLNKKLFFQWQTVGEATLPKALHIEDVATLTAIRYHVEAPTPVEQIDPGRIPTPPPD
mgnify:CR=1 FL=1